MGCPVLYCELSRCLVLFCLNVVYTLILSSLPLSLSLYIYIYISLIFISSCLAFSSVSAVTCDDDEDCLVSVAVLVDIDSLL